MKVTELVEISGTLENSMWYYKSFYPSVSIEELQPVNWPNGQDGKVYGQVIRFGAQSGTYIATGLHCYADGPDVASLPLERLIVPAVIARLKAGPRQEIDLQMLKSALKRSGAGPPRKGEALLLATGWDRYWNKDKFLPESPSLKYDLVRWVVDNKIGILGSDIPTFDPEWKENFWPILYASSTLVLAPLVNISRVRATRAKLYALPLKIRASCGSPVRAFLEL